MEKEGCTFSYCEKPDVEVIETDILLVGGGMGNVGTAYEACYWATPKNIKVTMVEKAAIERSGAIAMGLSAINTYIGMDVGENTPADFVDSIRGDLMGITREDIIFDIARKVDETVWLFEDWGLPLWRPDDEQGKPLRDGGHVVRSGRWQAMISGEAYKVIVAEAAKKALDYNKEATGQEENLYERVFITKLLKDDAEENRIAGAVGFSVRDGKVYIFKANAVVNACGGGVNTYRPRSTDEGKGRTWYPVWNSSSTTSMGLEVGAELTMMENVFVPARFKDGYGPVGTFFLFLKCKATNADGETYADKMESIQQYAPYCNMKVIPTCLRNHQMLQEMKAGKGPIYMQTAEPIQKMRDQDADFAKKLEHAAWEDFLDMTIAQAGVWAANNIAPEETPSEIMPTEPYFIGSHAACSGFWVSGPEDIAPEEWTWGYDRMTTVTGLFTCADGVGASGHKFSSGSFTDGRVAGKAAVAFVLDNPDFKPTVNTDPEELAAEIYQPMEVYEKYKAYTTEPNINPNYLKPRQAAARLMKIMDEYAGGVATWYDTSASMMNRALELLAMLREDLEHQGAEDLHELMRAWENKHRALTAEAHVRHMLFREETRYPGYYYRTDFPQLDEENWKVFVNSTYDAENDTWDVKKVEWKELVKAPAEATAS
jgi:adenylylsulfate reductase subunit A